MPSHASPKSQYVEHAYRVVAVGRDGVRTTLSQHELFLLAERARKTIPSEEGIEIRIEMAAEAVAVRLVG